MNNTETDLEWPKPEWTPERMSRHCRTVMRCYALGWKEHRDGMPRIAACELRNAISYRERARENLERGETLQF